MTKNGWPHTESAPLWKDDLLIERRFNPQTYAKSLSQNPESLTAFFHQMSGGRLWLYGDAYTYDGPPLRKANARDARARERTWRENNTRILQWFADRYNHKSYDNDGNGAVDLIILVCRSRPDFGYQGIAKLPINAVRVKNDEPRIVGSSGVYQKGCYNFHESRSLIAHEIGHKLGLPHDNGLHSFNLMSGLGPKAPRSSGSAMSAFEKNRLSWLEYSEIHSDTQNVRLGNLTQTNKAFKIPVAGSRDYFVIEDRRFSRPFEPRPGGDVFFGKTLPGEGLLIYLVQNRKPHILPADGKVATNIGGDKKYYHGDASDLYGVESDAKSVLLAYPKTVRQRPGFQTSILVENIRREKHETVFDIRFGVTLPQKIEKPASTRRIVSVTHAPDPFTWKTWIRYNLPQAAHVRLTVYDERGKLVKKLVDQFQNAWDYEVEFDGYSLNSGRYRYVFEALGEKQQGWMTFKSALR